MLPTEQIPFARRLLAFAIDWQRTKSKHAIIGIAER